MFITGLVSDVIKIGTITKPPGSTQTPVTLRDHPLAVTVAKVETDTWTTILQATLAKESLSVTITV